MEYMEYILAFYLTFFLASILEILYGIFSGIHSDILFVMCLGPGVAHCIQSSRYGVRVQTWTTQYPELAKEMKKMRDPQDSGVGG